MVGQTALGTFANPGWYARRLSIAIVSIRTRPNRVADVRNQQVHRVRDIQPAANPSSLEPRGNQVVPLAVKLFGLQE